jgi:hypothetical protein
MVESWGWRIPFLIGITVGVVGLYIRRHLIEESGQKAKEASLSRRCGVKLSFVTDVRISISIMHVAQ